MLAPTKVCTRWLVAVIMFCALPAYAQLNLSKHVIDNSASGGFWLVAYDLDDDGDQDLLVATLNSGIKWYRNSGGSFTRINISTNFPDSWSIHAADFDGDGDNDIVACSGGSEDWTGPSEVAWWENDGSENFTKHTVDTQSSHPHAVRAADLDDDGDNDIAIAAWEDDEITWLRNNGTGNFTRLTLDGNFSSGHVLHAADMNLDGRVDLLAGGGGRTAWYRNNGDGSFTKNLVASGGAYSVYPVDMNGDGSPDILRGRRDNYDIDWLQGPGFTIRQIESAYSEVWSIVGADLDGDSDIDLVTPAFAKNGGSTENRVSYWINNGSQSFDEVVIESSIVRPKAVDVADFDRDGDPDIALITRQGNVIWYEISGGGAPVATITLTSPNGGEILAPGAVHNITWTSTGDIADVRLEVSADGGTTYTDIIASTPNDGLHPWTVPVVTSATVLVRVSDAADGNPLDVSNSVFTISGPTTLTLTSPNGGEAIAAGGIHFISWTSTGTIAAVKLEYSLNNGANYNLIIANTPNDGTHSWSVPDVNSTQALVRISDAADNDPSDVSNAVFSINPQTSLTLTFPNGGQVLSGGSTQNITWSSTGTIAAVKLEYSLDDGANFTEIIANTLNDGSHEWSLPAINSTQMRVRVSDAADGSPIDASDASFTIDTQTLTLTSPNGGESWQAGSTQNITWNSTGTIAAVKLEYSLDNGGSWTDIIASTANDGSHSWTVPSVNSLQALVRISDAADASPSDVSNSAFNINFETILVTSPIGGQNLIGGTIHQITWTSSGTIALIKIEYSIDAGAQYTSIIASTANDGSFSWTVPNVSSNQAFVRVSDAADDAPSDVNDLPFTIELASESFTLSAPNGGEVWSGGSSQSITWTSTGNVSAVKLEYSTNSGTDWIELTASAANNGLLGWTVPAINSTTALVRISDSVDGIPSDVSDAVFTIDTQSLTLTSPNGGENLDAGAIEPITWNSTGLITNVKLEYSTDDGQTWNAIANSAPNNGTHNWEIPQIDAAALVRISDAADGTPSDVSSASFAIVISTLAITNPNGGESWFGGSNQDINWAFSGIVENVRLEYSLNNGAAWTELIHTTPNDGAHPWIVPNTPTGQALIRVSDATDGVPSDASDTTFSIVNSTVAITSPNGGEIWTGESLKKITWTWNGNINAIKLEYSINNGSSWNTIVASTGNTGSYNWTLPDVATGAAMVRVTNANGVSPSDVSDGVFTIIGSSLTLISPNGGENWNGNSDQSIQWSSTGVFPFVKIEYSLDGGTNWVTLEAGVTNIGSYTWRVVNTGSEQVMIRISDANDAQPMDISNSVFKITQVIVSVEETPELTPKEFALAQNYPNPFNPETKIDFSAPVASPVRLSIYNMRGELVRVLVDENYGPGVYTAVWNGLDNDGATMPSGIYVYRIQIGDWSASKKLLLVK
jgi:hypothetical protein